MIKLKNVSKNFFNRGLFSNVNIEIPLNQVTFIIGQSGSGKTTLINMIGGIEKVDSGWIILETKNQTINMQNDNLTGLVDFVFQDFNLFNNLTVIDNLKVGTKISGRRWSKQDSIAKLKEFDFEDDVGKVKASELSGGEQQRLSLIRALERNSKIILIDEPTGNLDEESAQMVFETLKELSKTKTIIIVSHDDESAEKYADNILKIEDKKIISVRKNPFQDHDIVIAKEEKDKNALVHKLSIMPTLAISDIKKRKITFILLLLSIFFIMISTVITGFSVIVVFDIDKNQVSKLNLDSMVLTKRQDVFKNVENNKKIEHFTQEENEKLKNDPNIKFILDEHGLLYESFAHIFGLFSERELIPANIKFDQTEIINDPDFPFVYESITNDDFFKNRLKTNGLVGEPIQNENEIVLGKSFSDKLNDPNIIGKNILLTFLSNNISPLTLKVVGINTNQNHKGQYINYINAGVWRGIHSMFKSVKFRPSNITPLEINSFAIAPFVKQIDNFELLVGANDPNASEPLLISSQLVKLWKDNNIDVGVGTEFTLWLKQEAPERKFIVSGVFQSDKLLIKFSNKTFNSLRQSIEVDVTKRIYIDPNSNYDRVFRDLSPLNSKIRILENLTNFRTRRIYGDSYFIIVLVFWIMLLLSLLLGIISTITFGIMLAGSKKREITIIKILGAKLWQLIYYSMGNFLFIMGIILIMSIIFSFSTASIIYNTVLLTTDYVYIHFDRITELIFIVWSSILLMFGFIFFLTSLFTNLKSYRKSKANL